MRLRSLSVALLAGVALVPVSASAASASADSASVASGAAGTFKTSAAQRAKRAALSAPAQSARTAGPTVTVSYASRVLTLTNAERTRRGLRALSFSSCAEGFADTWADRLAAAGSLSHQALSPILSACSARGVGENVAFGNVSPEQLVAMWMGSTGHRANILNPSFTHLGVGDVTTSTGRVYGVQVFLTL